LYRKASASLPIQGPNIQWILGRLDDPESLAQLLSGSDTVIHGAGIVRGSEWRHFEKVNTEGVARMVQTARQMHPSPRFLLLSSLTAREPQLSHYAASKRLGEKVLESDGGDLEWAVLRPPAVYGPGDREIAPLLQWMCRGVAPQASSRASKFSMLYIDDLADAIVALLEQAHWQRSTFELHDGRSGGYHWGEVVQVVSRVAARNVFCFKLPRLMIRTAAAVNLGAARICGYAPMLTPGKVRELEHPDWICDNTVFSKATGWQPRTDLAEGIRRTLVYLKVIADKPNRTTRGTQHADV
jgi:nucleoside-diphosphate-sugar epimerase